MNQVKATITSIERVDSITIVAFEAASQPMKMMALELNDALDVGREVVLSAKATNIALAKEKVENISISNQLEATITAVEMGTLLCSVCFSFGSVTWESVITRDSAQRMELKPGDSVVALIKSSDLSMAEVLS